MDKYKTKTSFNKWFSSIKLKVLSKEAKQHIAGFNRYVKKFHFETALKLFLHGINTEKESLRHLDTSMVSPDLQRELGLDSISHTQLSRTLTNLSPAVLWEIFLQLVRQAEKLEGRTNPHKLFIVDSTTFSLNKQRYPWAKFRKTKAGVKLHLKVCFMEKNQVYPTEFKVTSASEHDNSHLDCLVNDRQATYVFDRGYDDYRRLDQMNREGYYFVTRLKKDAKRVDPRPSAEVAHCQEPIESDILTCLGGANHVTERFRVITVKRKGKDPLRLVTNRHDLPADTISAIYRSRWEIELFFKHIKQHLTIKTYFSRSEQGVTNQLILAMIAYLLTFLLQRKTKTRWSHFQVLRRLRAVLFEPYERLLALLIPT